MVEKMSTTIDHLKFVVKEQAETIDRLTRQLEEVKAKRAICDVITMKHSSGFPDHFTRVRVGDRHLMTWMSKIKGQCEYYAAKYDWLLNGEKQPGIMDFDYTEPEGLAEYLKETRHER